MLAGARVLQRRGRRAHGRRVLVATSTRAVEEAARMLGASRWRAFRHGHVAAARARSIACGRVDRVPVHVHVVRRGVAARAARATRRSRWRSTGQAVELLDLPTAAALALVQISRSLAVLFVHGAAAQERRARRAAARRRTETARRRARAGERVTRRPALLGVTAVFLGGPTRRARRGGRCTRAGGWGLASYRALGSSAADEHAVRVRRGRRCATRWCSHGRDRDRAASSAGSRRS